jgi:predicted DNA-binding protein (UPF0251 family)
VPRPRKRRVLSRLSHPAIYKPAGIPLDSLNQVRLLQEELEALRLADLEGMTQVEAAQQMGISRSTFQRILSRAHRQIALALCEGQALQIVGVELDRPPTKTHPSQNKARKRRH